MGRYALLVGVSGYDDPRFQELRAPTHDVRQLAALLRDPDIGQYDEVTTLVDVGTRALQVAIAELTAGRTRDDTVLLYLSCHGVKDETGRLYFAAKDTSNVLLTATGVSSEFVQEHFARCVAGVRVQLLDCCFSAAFATGFATRSADRVLSREDFGRGYVAITATNHFEYAWEPAASVVPDEPTTSVFTEAVLDALADEAADRDGDGWISDRDLYEYVHQAVRERTSGAQTPTHFAFDLQGTVVLAKAVGARPAEPPVPPMTTAPAPPPEPPTESPAPENEPEPAPVTPGQYVFDASRKVDVAALGRQVEQGELSVDEAIVDGWQMFTTYVLTARDVAGLPTRGPSSMAMTVAGLVQDRVLVIETVTAMEEAAREARTRDSDAEVTRLGMRRLRNFLADVTAVVREIDAFFDVAPPVFADLLADVAENAPVRTLHGTAAVGFTQFGVYVDRVARAWGIPRPPESGDEAPAGSETQRAVRWLSEESGDPDMAPLVREVDQLADRLPTIARRAEVTRFLTDLTTIAGDLEEQVRTVHHHRAKQQARQVPVSRRQAAPAQTAGDSWDGTWVLGIVAIIVGLGVVASIVYGVGPTYVGFTSSGGSAYRVDHTVSLVPGRTRFVWELKKGGEVATTLKPTDPDQDISTLAGHIALATDGKDCRNATVEWRVKGKNYEVTGTSRIRDGETTNVELDDKDINVKNPGDKVEFTARRTDSEDCTTHLEWTRPGYDS